MNIKFKKMSLEENIEIIKWTFYENEGTFSLHDYTVQCFPELKELNLNDSKEKNDSVIEKVVTKHYNDNNEKLLTEIERYNNIWDKYNDKYFKMLIEYFKIDFPDNINEIEAIIGLIPVCPRYLNSFSFSLYPDMDDWKVIEVCAHEILHFLWFEKFNKLYPEIPRENYDSPHLEWKYSEMVTDPILNNKPFSDLFNFTEKGYDYFYELYDGNELVMDKLREIYSTGSVDERIKNGFNYIKNVFDKAENHYK